MPLIAAHFHVPGILLIGIVGPIFLIGYTIEIVIFGVYTDMFWHRTMPGTSTAAFAVVTVLSPPATGLQGAAT
ncbi:MAG TPA: hypothetical protein VMD98_05025 [Bryocella sp.]|nr:hypothetical protein [Bryocella sp.]